MDLGYIYDREKKVRSLQYYSDYFENLNLPAVVGAGAGACVVTAGACVVVFSAAVYTKRKHTRT